MGVTNTLKKKLITSNLIHPNLSYLPSKKKKKKKNPENKQKNKTKKHNFKLLLKQNNHVVSTLRI